MKAKLDKQFEKFLEVFKKLDINNLFVDVLAQMLNYVKFMKDILSKKHKLEEFEMVAFIEKCYAILLKKPLPKLKDPWSFCIPYIISQCSFEKAPYDMDASINLIPLLIYRKLGLREIKLTIVSLLLANQSIKHLKGILEDVLVELGKFIFLANFIVLNMEGD